MSEIQQENTSPMQPRAEGHHAYYEETKDTSSLFTVVVLLHWQLHLSSLFISDLAFSRIML